MTRRKSRPETSRWPAAKQAAGFRIVVSALCADSSDPQARRYSNSGSPPEVFGLEGGQPMANFPDDLVFSKRPGGGGFGQVGFHQLGVQGDGLVGAFQGLVV